MICLPTFTIQINYEYGKYAIHGWYGGIICMCPTLANPICHQFHPIPRRCRENWFLTSSPVHSLTSKTNRAFLGAEKKTSWWSSHPSNYGSFPQILGGTLQDVWDDNLLFSVGRLFDGKQGTHGIFEVAKTTSIDC